jgi:hypothetical protein
MSELEHESPVAEMIEVPRREGRRPFKEATAIEIEPTVSQRQHRASLP